MCNYANMSKFQTQFRKPKWSMDFFFFFFLKNKMVHGWVLRCVLHLCIIKFVKFQESNLTSIVLQ